MTKTQTRSYAIITTVVVATAIFVSTVIIFGVGKFTLGHPEEVKVVFNFVNGLDANAPVRFGGALVGKVDRVEVLNASEKAELGQTKNILVTISINHPVELTEGTEVTVNTMGFVGEKYIEIRPGPPGSPPLKGNLLVGNDPAQMEKLIASGQKLVDELLVTADNLNRVTRELDARIPGLTDKMERAFDNTDRAMSSLGSEDAQEQIRAALANLKIITTYGKVFSATVAEKPWRLIWGGKVRKLPSEEEILDGVNAAEILDGSAEKPATADKPPKAAKPVKRKARKSASAEKPAAEKPVPAADPAPVIKPLSGAKPAQTDQPAPADKPVAASAVVLDPAPPPQPALDETFVVAAGEEVFLQQEWPSYGRPFPGKGGR